MMRKFRLYPSSFSVSRMSLSPRSRSHLHLTRYELGRVTELRTHEQGLLGVGAIGYGLS